VSVARTTEIISMSESSFEDAIKTGIERASSTLRNLKSVWIKDQEITMNNGKVEHYKVAMKVTFILDK
jgi:hypothetical protein